MVGSVLPIYGRISPFGLKSAEVYTAWRFHLQNCRGLIRISLYSVLSNNMTKELHSFLNSHFPGFSVTPADFSRSRVLYNQVSCSFTCVLKMITSSIKYTTPGKPSRIFPICHWNSSCAQEILNVSLLKQYLA